MDGTACAAWRGDGCGGAVLRPLQPRRGTASRLHGRTSGRGLGHGDGRVAGARWKSAGVGQRRNGGEVGARQPAVRRVVGDAVLRVREGGGRAGGGSAARAATRGGGES